MAIHPNQLHEDSLTTQERIALRICNAAGTMWCVYVFSGIGVGSLVGVFTNNAVLALAFGAFSSYFIQLVFLPLLQIGQKLQQRHSELRAEAAYQAVRHAEEETEAIHDKLDELLKRIPTVRYRKGVKNG